MKHAFIAVLTLVGWASATWAQYAYYYSDPLTTINGSNWTQNVAVTAGSAGITSSTYGSLISKITAPTYPNDYMVTATVNLPSSTNGGYYGVMTRATSNALMTPTFAQGSFYLLELQNPTWSGGTCSATLTLWKSISGTLTSLYSTSTWCSSSFTFGMSMNGSLIVLMFNGQFISWQGDSSLATGQAGLNVRSAPSTGTMSNVNLGPGDHTAPGTIDLTNLATSSYSNRIDMQWKAPSDGPSGSGLGMYFVSRGGVTLAAFNPSAGEFTDNTVAAGTPYSYSILSCDLFGNCSTTNFSATSAPAGSIDPRQIGMPPNGTSWGGGGENINILSGNLNYSLPLLRAQGRGGTGVTIGLNYNSQNWREDSTVSWNYGRDTGYGWGFRLLAGSIQQFYNAAWGVDHWEFTDSTGTQYRLNQQVTSIQTPTPTGSNTGIWSTSTDGAAFLYNANTNQLYFPNGTVWTFGCTSLGTEGDASAKYPTQIEDSNGNQILIRYEPGLLAVNGTTNIYLGFGNSSGRIAQIEDVRAQSSGGSYVTYQFTYNSDPGVPHLTGITNNISTSEGYSFAYTGSVSLTSPWGANFLTVTQLTSVTISGIGLEYQFSYDGAFDLTKTILPYGGYIGWQYGSAGYSGSRNQVEVTGRTLSPDGSTVYTYPFVSVTHDSNNTMRQSVTLNDPGITPVGQKVWTFNPSGTGMGLLSQYQGRDLSLGTTLQQVSTSWTAAAFGPYLSGTTLTLGGTNPVTKTVNQTLDQFGNMTLMTVIDFNGSTHRYYTNTFLNNSSYASRYIMNRLQSTTVTQGGTTTPLVNNQIDTDYNTMPTLSSPREFDPTYTPSVVYRGNITGTQTFGLGTYSFVQHDNAGNVIQVTNNGVTSSMGTASTTNYAAPAAVTTVSVRGNPVES